MINGAHVAQSPTDAEAGHAFLADALPPPDGEAGDRGLLRGRAPAEMALHPSDKGEGPELFLMCEDIGRVASRLGARGVGCTPSEELRWGRHLHSEPPGGAMVGVHRLHDERPSKP